MGYTVRITESYHDVSDRVLAAVTNEMEPFARTKAIEKRKKELAEADTVISTAVATAEIQPLELETTESITSEKPIIALSGVRSS